MGVLVKKGGKDNGNTNKQAVRIAEPLIETAHLHQKLSKLDPDYYSKENCEKFAYLIDKIKFLKKQLNAIALVHNYQRPEIFEIADSMGDSLGLSKEAAKTNADVIVFCGVRFMAETAKILNPNKTVLLPNLDAGCSLAETATAEAVREKKEELKAKYGEDLAVVGYVNTAAEVKAECDVSCTSANAVKIVKAMPEKNILFLPDRNLASYVQSQVPGKEIIPWKGNCYVHQEITAENILEAKHCVPNAKVLVHPECRSDVIALADFVASTEGMVKYAKQNDAKEFIIVTECGLSDRLLLEVPEKRFFKSCKLCRQMKVTTLEDIANSLENLKYKIELDEEIRVKAEKSIKKMLELDT